MQLDDLLMNMVDAGCSDLHLKVGRPPLMRRVGELKPTEMPPLDETSIRELIYPILNDGQRKRFERDRELDFAYELAGTARFRVNLFHQRNNLGGAIRLIPYESPTIDGLQLPKVLKDLASRRQGLILVTGPTGSGKSTTLAAMIQHVNQTRYCHVITIEDPIEFVHVDENATINQRELGVDVLDVNEALRRTLRQDPDVIMVGEIRDRETVELAMHAAETGHVVMSTLHTNDAKQTVDRIVDMFPTQTGNQIRAMLSLTLLGIISQRLLRRADETGRIVAMEILANSPNVAQLIEKGRVADLDKAMVDGASYYGMQTFNMHLASLVSQGIITRDEALANSSTPGDLELMLRGLGRGAVTMDRLEDFAPREEKKEEEKPGEEEGPKLKIEKGFDF